MFFFQKSEPVFKKTIKKVDEKLELIDYFIHNIRNHESVISADNSIWNDILTKYENREKGFKHFIEITNEEMKGLTNADISLDDRSGPNDYIFILDISKDIHTEIKESLLFFIKLPSEDTISLIANTMPRNLFALLEQEFNEIRESNENNEDNDNEFGCRIC